jgi:hypothetical protein
MRAVARARRNLEKREERVENWLKRTAAYIPTWIDYQLRSTNQVGCLLAILHDG